MIENTQKWGRAKARERYGKLTASFDSPPDQSRPRQLGNRDNLQGPDYDNKTPDNWLIGGGSDSAEGKPDFDSSEWGKGGKRA